MAALILRFGVALAIGLGVGLERAWPVRAATAASRAPGIPTFGLSRLPGGVAAAPADAEAGRALPAVAPASIAGVFAWSRTGRRVRPSPHRDRSGRGSGRLRIRRARPRRRSARRRSRRVATAAVLARREVLHGFLKRLTWEEVRSALLLLAITAIVLPLRPGRPPFSGW